MKNLSNTLIFGFLAISSIVSDLAYGENASSSTIVEQGTWQYVNNPNRSFGANNPLLLTDGSILFQNDGAFGFPNTIEIWKLSPITRVAMSMELAHS